MSMSNIGIRTRRRKHNRDLQFRLQGPVVAHLSEVFVDDWNFTTGEELRGAKWFPKLQTHEGNAFARGIESGAR